MSAPSWATRNASRGCAVCTSRTGAPVASVRLTVHEPPPLPVYVASRTVQPAGTPAGISAGKPAWIAFFTPLLMIGEGTGSPLALSEVLGGGGLARGGGGGLAGRARGRRGRRGRVRGGGVAVAAVGAARGGGRDEQRGDRREREPAAYASARTQVVGGGVVAGHGSSVPRARHADRTRSQPSPVPCRLERWGTRMGGPAGTWVSCENWDQWDGCAFSIFQGRLPARHTVKTRRNTT